LIRLFPDGFLALFAPAAAPPALLPPAPLIDDPVVVDGAPAVEPLPEGEPAAPVPADPPPAPPAPAWANARVFESANAVANAIVVSFMIVSFLS
jgi:hypothetical protein